MGFFSRLFNLDKFDAEASQLPSMDSSSDVGLARKEADAILAEIDIGAAISAHENWKDRLQKILDGNSSERLDPTVVCQDNRCDLGKWIYGPGSQHLGHFPAFQVLIARHKYFHEQAATVLSQAQSGANADARKTLNSSYKYASGQVILLLKELQRGLTLSR